MNSGFRLQIADLEFVARTEPGFEIVEDHFLYQEFVRSANTPGAAISVPVEIAVGDPSPDPSWAQVFDSNETWIALRDGDDLILAFPSPVELGSWWWSARLNIGRPEVEVVCDPEILGEGGGLTRIVNPLRYPLDQLLTMFLLAPRGGCIVHAAGLAVHGRGIAFVGRSGAGKTTLMSVIEEQPENLRLSDDRVIFRLENGGARIYGTPWAGEGMVAANANAGLEAIVFLHHGPENHLEPIIPSDAARQLLPTTSIPWFDGDILTGCIETLDQIVERIPCYNLRFRPDREVNDVIRSIF